MDTYAHLKEKITNQEPIAPSLMALSIVFELNQVDLMKELVTHPAVVNEISFKIDELAESNIPLLVYILNSHPFSPLYEQIKNEYLSTEVIWEAIVEIENIPRAVQGSYFTFDNYALIKQNNLQAADIILENKNHPVIQSLNKLAIKKEFKFSANLMVGSLFTYQGNINLDEVNEIFEEFKSAEAQLK